MDAMALIGIAKNLGVLKGIQVEGVEVQQLAEIFSLFGKDAKESTMENWVTLLRASGFKGSAFDYLMDGEWLSLADLVNQEHTGDGIVRVADALDYATWARSLQVQDMTSDDWVRALSPVGIDIDVAQAERLIELVSTQGYIGSLGSYLKTGGFLILFERNPDGTFIEEPWECRHCGNPNFTGHKQTERICSHCSQLNLFL